MPRADAVPVEFWETGNIEEHVELIRRQTIKSVRDPELRRLTLKIVNNTPDEYVIDPKTGHRVPIVVAYGQMFRLPLTSACAMKDAHCESLALWDFAVLNVRYVEDPDGFDLFCTAEQTLLAGGGDCFPEETLVLRADGALVPIGHVTTGDRIHDGTGFVSVLKTWDRGPKTIHRIGLSNQNTLRLSDTHKVLRVPKMRRSNGTYGPGLFGTEEEVRVADLCIDDDLLQPREFGGGSVELEDDDAFLVAMYLAEGCKFLDKTWLSLAGVRAGKGARERVEAILQNRAVRYQSYEREVRCRVADLPVLAELDLGRTAIDKHLPHMNWGPRTAKILLDTLEITDGGVASNGANCVFSSISYELALQYRVLCRMFGDSTSMTCLLDHGGAGNHPIYRVTRRVDNTRKPWARIRSLLVEPESAPCVDIMTSSGRVYLPESDVIVRQCDDFVILLGAMHKLVGFRGVVARVASTDNKYWEHVFLMVGFPKHAPAKWVALDPTVKGATPGWKYNGIKTQQDFTL